ncbi:hypothetical protein EJB05_29314, partial [Eragrostis curvula]
MVCHLAGDVSRKQYMLRSLHEPSYLFSLVDPLSERVPPSSKVRAGKGDEWHCCSGEYGSLETHHVFGNVAGSCKQSTWEFEDKAQGFVPPQSKLFSLPKDADRTLC